MSSLQYNWKGETNAELQTINQSHQKFIANECTRFQSAISLYAYFIYACPCGSLFAFDFSIVVNFFLCNSIRSKQMRSNLNNYFVIFFLLVEFMFF